MKIEFKITGTPVPAWLPTLGAAIAAVALRLLALPRALDTTDAVNFALALDRFDLTLHQPHFPGYPLYVLAARACAHVAEPAVALALPGVLGAVLLIFAIRRAVAGRAGERAGVIAAWLVAVAPPLVEVGALPGSDGLALALAGCAFAAALVGSEPGAAHPRLTRMFAGALLGLALGARPSYLPLAPSLLLFSAVLSGDHRGPAYALAGMAAAVVAWLLPLSVLVGARSLIAVGEAHVAGHFTTWGGSIASSSEGLAVRALHLVAHAAAGLLGAMALALLVQRATPVGDRLSRRVAVAVALAAAPYALWVWLAQNVDRTRHAAPLALLLCGALAIGLCPRGAVRPLRRWAPRAAVALTLTHALAAAVAASQQAPWRRDAIAWIEGRFGLDRVLLVGTHLPRVAAFYQPALRTDRALDGADVARIAAALGDGITVVASSEIPDLARPDLDLDPLVRFGDATLYAAHARRGGP